LYKPQMGVNWPPSSVDPETHRMFICGADQLGYSGTDVKDWAPPGAQRRGGTALVAQQGVVLPPGAPDLARGATQYRQLCIACHGESSTGGQNNGASLATIGRDPQALANTAWNGKNNVPPFRGSLTPEQIRDIARYITDELFAPHAL
jgi:mono/diheme cytochrome c family protein